MSSLYGLGKLSLESLLYLSPKKLSYPLRFFASFFKYVSSPIRHARVLRSLIVVVVVVVLLTHHHVHEL